EQERQEHVVLALGSPTSRVVELRLRNSALRPVSGCATTTLCSTGGHCCCIVVRSSEEWPSRIAFCSGRVMSWTARSPSSISRSAGDSASYAAYMLAKQVSPPSSGSCTARRIDATGGSA